MSILDGFFGSRRDVVWERLADEIGGSFFEGGLSPGGSKVRARVDGWVVTVDTYPGEHFATITKSMPHTSIKTILRSPWFGEEALKTNIVRVARVLKLGLPNSTPRS